MTRVLLALCFSLALGLPLVGVRAQDNSSPEGATEASPPTLEERLESLEAEPLPHGLATSIAYHLETSERIRRRHPDASADWRRQAERLLEEAEDGRDPYVEARGQLMNRGYRSEISRRLQGYAVYLPEDYDPSRRWPVYVALHGGSSNGNLFLGVVMGRNLDWETYSQRLYDTFTPRWHAPMIVVAPDGFGQVMWRWMGEQDLMDVLADVAQSYSIDPDRIVLGGLSNGGVGAYAIGTRHAWRFSAVQAMAGAPSWFQYTGGRPTDAERAAIRMMSGTDLLANAVNTDFRYYHGRTDSGPMRPAYVERLDRLVREGEYAATGTWFEAGHDILYMVLRHGRNFRGLAELRRESRPARVELRTSDYRAARQHWIEVTRMPAYPSPARVSGELADGTVALTTENVSALTLHIPGLPLDADSLRISVDDETVYEGAVAALGERLSVRLGEAGWELGFPPSDEARKRPGVSGPISDAYFGRMVHVYGTQGDEHEEALSQAARQGARGWPVWLWGVEQEVVADHALTDEHRRNAHLVLYGNADNNRVIAQMADSLPIRVVGDAIVAGDERFEGRDVGVRYVYPNPENRSRYVILQMGATPEAVQAGNRLPDFLADWIVYDRATTRRRSRLITSRAPALGMGYFTTDWELAPAREGGDPDAASPRESTLPVPRSPRRPPYPNTFEVPEDTETGRIAREIARRARTFYNFRGEIPGAQWSRDTEAVWRIRPDETCLAELERLGVPARPRPSQDTPVPTPVEITGPVGGVWFSLIHEERPLLVACELAVRLPALAEILQRHGITGVEVMSAWRSHPRTSYHTFGLALDISRVWTERGWLSVRAHYPETPDRRTCPAGRGRSRGGVLWRLACDMASSRLFSSVLTPNYNEGHRDHYHLDIRPADPRFFVR